MFNIAIVGCGYWGPNLLRNFNSLADCNVKYACDVDRDRLSHMKSLYPQIETTTDFDQVIADPDIDAVGSKKMLVYDDTEPNEKIKIYDKRVEVPPHYDTFAEFHYSYHYGDIHSPYLKQTEPLKVVAEHFINCIKYGNKPESCGEEAIKVVQILEAASESIKRGGAKVEISEIAQEQSTKDLKITDAKIARAN